MNSMHNRRGSVLLMAIGLLTILAILASTFLVISNLDSQETESLAVRAYADPIVEGLVAKAVWQISFDRAVSSGGPYTEMTRNSDGLVRFMDCTHAYTDAETADHWLSCSYLPGEGIGGPGQLTNLEGPANKNDYKLDAVIKFAEGTIYKDGQSDDGIYVDTDADGIPDAVLYDTKISSPGSDANTYYAAVRIVDLGAKMCINTAGGQLLPTDPLYGSGPTAVRLRDFLDNRTGGANQNYTFYTLLNEGDGASNRGRTGTANKLLQGYARYCAPFLLSPASPGQGGAQPYQPFGIGEEAFFLNACVYKDNLSQFAGRINQMMAPLATNATAIPDLIRRQLTTMSSVSAVVRWPEPANNFTEPLRIDTVQSQTECQLVYDRMKLMLKATGVGANDDARSRMAAHFAANLWAYSANGTIGEPWAFTPQGGANFTVFGLRQHIVITEVFARHIPNTQFDANDPTKDNSAWGFAVEVGNPSVNTAKMGDYDLVIRGAGGDITVSLGASSIFGATANATTPTKKVVYGYDCGPTCTDKTGAVLFGTSPGSWAKDPELKFFRGVPSLSVTLYYKSGGERVPVDYVSVGGAPASFDLAYDTSLKIENIAGDYKARIAPTATDKCLYIKRDDRLKAGGANGYRPARYNMAFYADGSDPATAALGKANGITEADLTHRSNYGAPMIGMADVSVTYSPGISRPRDKQLSSATDYLPSQDDYFLPSIADLCSVFLAGPIRDGAEDRPFTTEVIRKDLSCAFKDRPDIGRIPSAKPMGEVTSLTDMVDDPANAVNMKYPDVPPGYLFHEFFTRSWAHLARPNEKKRIYGLININSLAIGQNPGFTTAAWFLPWPMETSLNNRLGLGQAGKVYVRGEALKAIRDYRDQTNRAGPTGITGLRSAAGSNVEGFMTPGEVGIPLAMYMDTLLKSSSADLEKDSDYIRARNCLFGYISDCLSTRSDMYACYVSVQHGKNAAGRRWRYVAVIDRSNVVTPTDKAAVILMTQLR